MDMDEKIFERGPIGKAALLKFGDVPENFRIFEAGWTDVSFQTMEVIGAEFRRAKSGPNKGKLNQMIQGTRRRVLVSRSEMAIHDTRV